MRPDEELRITAREVDRLKRLVLGASGEGRPLRYEDAPDLHDALDLAIVRLMLLQPGPGLRAPDMSPLPPPRSRPTGRRRPRTKPAVERPSRTPNDENAAAFHR